MNQQDGDAVSDLDNLLASREMILVAGSGGVGKTTIGKRLARRLQLPFVDADDAIDASEAAAKNAKKKQPPASSTGDLQPAE